MKKILNIVFLTFFVLFVAYLAIEIIPSEYLGGIDRVRIISDTISAIGRELWAFSRPFIQLIIILVIVQTLFEKSGIHIDLKNLSLDWDIKSLIAIIIVIAFSISALGGMQGASILEDVTLVVIGFYFGGLAEKSRG